MKAIHVDTESTGRPLVWAEAEDPIPGPDDVLVSLVSNNVDYAPGHPRPSIGVVA